MADDPGSGAKNVLGGGGLENFQICWNFPKFYPNAKL